jgi:hypothetical protein
MPFVREGKRARRTARGSSNAAPPARPKPAHLSAALAVIAVLAASYQPGFSSLPQKSQHPGNVETEETAAMLAVAGCSLLFRLI